MPAEPLRVIVVIVVNPRQVFAVLIWDKTLVYPLSYGFGGFMTITPLPPRSSMQSPE